MRWLWVAFTLRFMLGDLKGTREVSEQALARSVSDPSCRCEAHHAMGGTLSSLGELDASRHHFEAALDGIRRAASAALRARLGPRRLRARLVRAHALAARRRARRGGACRAGRRARAAARSHVQPDARARIRRTPPPDAPRHGPCARVRGSGRGAVRAVRIRLLRRLGPASSSGGRAGRSGPPKASRSIESALERLDAKRAQARRPYYLSLLAETYSRAREPGSRGVDSGCGDHHGARARRRVVASRAVPPEERARAGAGARRDASPRARAGPRAEQPGPGAADSRVVDCQIDLSTVRSPGPPGTAVAAERFRERFGNARPHRLSRSGGSL